MKRLLPIFPVLLMALAGCAAKPVYRPVTIDVPVPVPCRAPEVARPAWPTQSLSAGSGLLDQVRALLAENELRQGYEARLEAALQACR